MTNLEMLKWGIQHIAENHGFHASVDCLEQEGEVCIWGGCNVPTLSDVQLLCEDLGIDRECIYADDDCGIDVFITQSWYDNKAHLPYKKGIEFWRRNN